MPCHVSDALQWTQETLEPLSNRELLEAIWAIEATYKGERDEPYRDHRLYLSREELVRVFFLVQYLGRSKTSARRADSRYANSQLGVAQW